VVDGTTADIKLVPELLRGRGYTVVLCDTGDRVWSTFQEDPADLVVLDAEAPGRDARDVCRLIRGHPSGRTTLILAVTVLTDPELLMVMLEAGVDDFVGKPIDPEQLSLRLTISERRLRDRRDWAETGHALDLKTTELQTLVDSIPEVFLSVDLGSGRVTEVSPQVHELFGITPEVFMNDPDLWKDYVLPGVDWDDLTANPPLHTLSSEYQVTSANGPQRWIRASVSVFEDPYDGLIWAHGVMVDHTAEHTALVEAAARNADLQGLYRLSEIILTSSALGDAHAKLLDHVREVLGCRIAALELLDSSRMNLVVVAARGIDLPEGGFSAVDIDDSLSGVAVRTGSPLMETQPEQREEPKAPFLEHLILSGYAAFPLWTDGEIIGTLTLASTEPKTFDERFHRMGAGIAAAIGVYVRRLEAEVALRDSEARYRILSAELRQANEELEAFAYSVSHDLRAPLRTMQGFAHTLQQRFEAELPTEARDFLDRIITSGRHSEELIGDLLEYSRLTFESIEVKPVQLSSVLETTLEQLRADVEASRAGVEVPPVLPVVLGNHTMLVQVFTNLLSNSMKFVPGGQKPMVVIRTEDRDGEVRIRVDDNGVGIPEGQEDRIFQVFERLRGVQRFEGTGIGLAIVRRCVQRMGGTWGVDRLPDGGSSFWVQLSRAP
jgi:signal transduction histidine kinase/AmiR/NasT family two-component response regulator